MTEVVENEPIIQGEEEENIVIPGDENPLTVEVLATGISTIARTGDGLGHAFIRMDLSQKGLSSVGLLSQFPHLRFVNLSENEIRDLTPTSQMQYLQYLNVSKNKIAKLSLSNKPYLQQIQSESNEISAIEVSSLPLLSVWNLNGNRLFELNVPELPMLRQLECRNNAIDNISRLATPKLQKLYLAQNRLTSLSEVGNKENLEVIHARENQISKLDGFTESNKKLAILNLRSNQIASMEEVDKLKCLKGLSRLVLQGNPVEDTPNYRLEVLLRLPWLKKLDKTEITQEELNGVKEYNQKMIAKRLEEENARKEAEQAENAPQENPEQSEESQ